MVRKLSIPMYRAQLEPVFLYLVYANQDSKPMMTALCQSLPSLLTSHTHEQGEMFRQRLEEVAKYLLTLHSDLSQDTVSALSQAVVSVPQVSQARASQLKEKLLTEGGVKEDQGAGAAVATFQTKQVGLINLGNTCYMNCVLQALYHTRMFRGLVIGQDWVSSLQRVLTSLQQVFVFLRYSKRSIFSPSEFLRLARPSWFEAGRQQDCSEFLTHLLDTLQEEEKSCQPKEETVTSEPVKKVEETIVDNDEIMKSCENIAVTHDEEDSEDEAKDTVDDQMLKITKVDKLGSSSSLGMSRWSTEENLSLGDSREALNSFASTERLQTSDSREVLNSFSSPERPGLETSDYRPETSDSHSNSSDSGIHSAHNLSLIHI